MQNKGHQGKLGDIESQNSHSAIDIDMDIIDNSALYIKSSRKFEDEKKSEESISHHESPRIKVEGVQALIQKKMEQR